MHRVDGQALEKLQAIDALDLKWSNRGDVPVDLYHDVEQFIDVICLKQGRNKLYLQTSTFDAHAADALDVDATFRMQIQVFGDGVKSSPFHIDVEWSKLLRDAKVNGVLIPR